MRSDKKIQVETCSDHIVAEWYPLQSGSPVVGRGTTVLEAVGSLVVNSSEVELLPSPLIDQNYSIREPKPRGRD